MSALETAKNKAREIMSNAGRAGLHALSPDDFEYYALSFELLKSSGDVEQIFHFPVMPTGINIDGQSILNIVKTGTGTSVQFNDSFVPKNITINGTFGRKFRLLVTDNTVPNKENTLKQKIKNLDLNVKTGYGAMKMMEDILDKLYKLDEFQMPRFMILHNYAFNQSLVVEIISKTFSQSVENNMMWNYNIQMKGIADASKLVMNPEGRRNLKDLLAVSSLQYAANRVFSNINMQHLNNIII